jgi:hypothetical protein
MRMTLVALSTILLATPVSATKAPAEQNQASKAANTQAPKELKYCIQYEEMTGSRTSGRTECKTKATWAREGVDVDKLSDK